MHHHHTKFPIHTERCWWADNQGGDLPPSPAIIHWFVLFLWQRGTIPPPLLGNLKTPRAPHYRKQEPPPEREREGKRAHSTKYAPHPPSLRSPPLCATTPPRCRSGPTCPPPTLPPPRDPAHPLPRRCFHLGLPNGSMRNNCFGQNTVHLHVTIPPPVGWQSNQHTRLTATHNFHVYHPPKRHPRPIPTHNRSSAETRETGEYPHTGATTACVF